MTTSDIDLDEELVLDGFGADELGQIRTLLFGEHARQTLERVDRVQGELLTAISHLRDHVDARFAELDSRVTAEVDVRTQIATNLVGRLDEESQARRDSHSDLRVALDRGATEIREQFETARSELAHRIASMNADMRERDIDLRNRDDELRERSDDLHGALAGLFGEVARGLESKAQ